MKGWKDFIKLIIAIIITCILATLCQHPIVFFLAVVGIIYIYKEMKK